MLVEQHSKGWQGITPILILDNGHILEFSLKSSFVFGSAIGDCLCFLMLSFEALLKVTHTWDHTHMHQIPIFFHPMFICCFVTCTLFPSNRRTKTPLTHLHQIKTHSSIGFHFIFVGQFYSWKSIPSILTTFIHHFLFSFENSFLIKSCSSIHQTSWTIHLIWCAFFQANHQSQFQLEKQKTQDFLISILLSNCK